MPTFRDAYTARNGRRFAAIGTHPNGGIPASCYIKAKAEIRSYADASAFLAEGTQNNRLVASHVTIARRSPTTIAVRLYNTDIITYHSDETFSFSNGGFYTPTTSTRCNQFGPKGYHFSHGKRILHANGTPEQDGIRLPVYRDGNPVRPKVEPAAYVK